MIFFARVAQPEGSEDFSWVIDGLGSQVELVSAVWEGTETDSFGIHQVYKVFNTGPDGATGVVANEVFFSRTA